LIAAQKQKPRRAAACLTVSLMGLRAMDPNLVMQLRHLLGIFNEVL
jgi:hypothetical protein